MLIHDPVTRDRLWEEADKACQWFRHPLSNAQTFLDRTDKGTKVFGWMAGIAYYPEIQRDLSKSEFSGLFAVRWVPRSLFSELSFAQDGVLEADVRWGNRHTYGWFTILAWTCWKNAGDPEQGTLERAYWWSLLNALLAHVERHGSVKKKEGLTAQVQVVFPAALMKHPALFGGKEGYGLPWHQLSLLHHTGMNERDFTSPKTLLGMQKAMKEDLTGLLFDADHGNKILTIPVDPCTAPFFPNPVNPKHFSVVGRMVEFYPDPLDPLPFVDALVDKLSATFRSHAVEPQAALERSLEIAVAALAVAAGRNVPAEEIEGMQEVFYAQNFDADHAGSWVGPLTEALRIALPRG